MPNRESKFYILPMAAPTDERVAVLKHDDTFAVFDRFGDIHGEHGLFYEDTRYLSGLLLRIEDERPLLLSSMTQESDASLTINLTNSDLVLADGSFLSRGTLHVLRSKMLWHGVCYEQLRLYHYGTRPVRARLRLAFHADFADIFEVRGTSRRQRGRLHDPVSDDGSVLISYGGLDRRQRQMRISYSERPAEIQPYELTFELLLEPGVERDLYLTYACEPGPRSTDIVAQRESHEAAVAKLYQHLSSKRAEHCQIITSSARFNEWIARSIADLSMMTTDTAQGPYPYAGVPWFSSPFGRDGIITGLESLWVEPRIAAGVLRFLSATQSSEVDPARAAEPGKILHEARKGEMANLGEVPFGRYYGSVDSTPLFVLLASCYYEATADQALIEEIWPNIERAMLWIERWGDRDGDGFVEYTGDPSGLIHQGWKDSMDSVFHADGSEAVSPIALCEVQGYVFAAYEGAAMLARRLEHRERAEHFMHRARNLKERFEQAFWCEDLGTYALALDGNKRPCRVRTSNAGHCLFTRIASPEHAARLARTLFDEHTYSGWGIRTLARGESRYNPMSYHNGSIWPHDNALVAAGLARYGYRAHALRIMMGLYETTLYFDTQRLPELFCGFARKAGAGPTIYPVACSPQSWASGAAFMLLQACLGMSIDAPRQRLSFSHPVLPPFLQELRINQLRVGKGTIDLIVHRYPDDVGINVLRRQGQIEVINVK